MGRGDGECVASDTAEALAVSLAIYRERANAWPGFAAPCWRHT
jgi:hypothetical protein